MKYLKLITAVIIIQFLLNASSCENGDEEFKCTPENTVYFPEDALARFYFDDGSYWIYKDSISGMTDSIWIDNSYHEIAKALEADYGKVNKCIESFGYNLISEFYGKSRISSQIYDININIEKNDYGLYDMAEIINYDIVFRLLMHGNSYDSLNASEAFQKIADSVIVNNTVYNNVLRIYYSEPTYDYLLDAYYARNIGLIKFKRKDGSIWELIKYNIVQ